ncbi:endonuclease/exonuclease/phosphatase family protein [candidate division KSB1 bacterium]|nr:endonuclease/exonuclease/phosphatase family protein [candidate division KSB1 bacterium]
MQQKVKCKKRHALVTLMFLFILSCDPLVTTFDDIEDGKLYTAKTKHPAQASVDTICVMTWNIRYGAGLLPWFGDSNGNRVIFTEDEVYHNLKGIAAKIEDVRPDILLVQEIDVQSKRTAYIDQLQWLLDHTYLNYGTYASVWKAQIVPSDGLGRLDMGNAILSRWPITYAERIKLPQRGDQDALTKYFYLRRNILKAKIALPGLDEFYVLDFHASAFSTDDTKKRQIDLFKAELDKLVAQGIHFVSGGDFNSLPVNATRVDFCLSDKDDDESFHGPNDNPQHKEGSWYENEITWMQSLYDSYTPAVSLEDYGANESFYFTHAVDATIPYDRKLDYLWAKVPWVAGSDSTHQDARLLSDHAPLSVEWEVPK